MLPKLIGHRGLCGYAPENTLASLRKAAELKVPWVEFDVTLTQDGQAIVFHDETLERTTNGRGRIDKHSYAEVAHLDAGSWFSPDFKNEKIPTFEEYLDLAIELGLGINPEIKPTPGKEQETAQKVVEILSNYDFSQKLLVSSFSVESLMLARQLDRQLPLGLLINRWFDGWQETLLKLNCVSLNARYSILTPEKVSEVTSLSCQVLAYTVNDPKKAEELYRWGVRGVFSDIALRTTKIYNSR